MKIKDLPNNEKPRERMLLYGSENLSNTDLISIILSSGTKDMSVKEISEHVLKTIGNINNLSNIGIRELSKIKGIGEVKAITLLAAIELGKRVSNKEITLNMQLKNSDIVHEYFKTLFKNLKQEKFIAIYLDNKKRLISYKTLFIGTLNQSVVHPREIFNEAIKLNACTIICIHNHPSMILEPSKEDIEFTESLIKTGNIIGIPLIDHIITNGEEYFSFYESKIKTH